MKESDEKRERIRRLDESTGHSGRVGVNFWADAERKRVVAYEYLCHLEETRR